MSLRLKFQTIDSPFTNRFQFISLKKSLTVITSPLFAQFIDS